MHTSMQTSVLQKLDGTNSFLVANSDGSGSSGSGRPEGVKAIKIVDSSDNCKVNTGNRQNQVSFLNNHCGNRVYDDVSKVCTASLIKPGCIKPGCIKPGCTQLAESLDAEGIEQYTESANTAMVPTLEHTIKVSEMPEMYEKLKDKCELWGYKLAVVGMKLIIEITAETKSKVLSNLLCEDFNDYAVIPGEYTTTNLKCNQISVKK